MCYLSPVLCVCVCVCVQNIFIMFPFHLFLSTMCQNNVIYYYYVCYYFYYANHTANQLHCQSHTCRHRHTEPTKTVHGYSKGTSDNTYSLSLLPIYLLRNMLTLTKMEVTIDNSQKRTIKGFSDMKN